MFGCWRFKRSPIKHHRHRTAHAAPFWVAPWRHAALQLAVDAAHVPSGWLAMSFANFGLFFLGKSTGIHGLCCCSKDLFYRKPMAFKIFQILPCSPIQLRGVMNNGLEAGLGMQQLWWFTLKWIIGARDAQSMIW